MDLSFIKKSITKELSQATPLHSLELQNHLYGCFIVMEDLAQHVVQLQEDHLIRSDGRFSLLNQFHQIGVHYGFIQDPHLELHVVSSEYRDQWIAIFREVYCSSSLDQVDAIEDAVITILHEVVSPAYEFFIQASSSGSLSQEWVMKALALLHPALFPASDLSQTVSSTTTATTTVHTAPSVNETTIVTPHLSSTEEEPPTSSALAKANPENKMHPGTHHHYVKKKVRFDHTRRNGQNGQNGQKEVLRKGFSKTRRQLTGL